MGRRLDLGFHVGLLLAAGGSATVLSLLLPGASRLELAIAIALVAGGLALTRVFLVTRGHGLLVSAAALTAVGMLVGADTVAPMGVGERVGAALFTLLGLAFLVVAAVPPVRWGPLIPAGVMLTLAATILGGRDSDAGGVVLAGLAATFLAVFALPPAPLRRLWALMTAGLLVLLDLPLSGLPVQVFGVVTALALMAGGTLLILLRGPRAPA